MGGTEGTVTPGAWAVPGGMMQSSRPGRGERQGGSARWAGPRHSPCEEPGPGALGRQLLAGAQKAFSPWRRHCQPQGLIAKSPTLKARAGDRSSSKDAERKTPPQGPHSHYFRGPCHPCEAG